ncbi:helix-turn-helix transcriptional regulator [Alkalinema pantanalense CENA528]|uniref:helix-turn-helix transcriptional regulator n=1 Tax=Alkalinema pantanalense TaxID=1620705 RepID=UPI003D6F31AF
MPHPYSQPAAFDRLLILITTLLHHPGIGSADPLTDSNLPHDAMVAVSNQVKTIAQTLGFPSSDWSVHTLRKDLRTLRTYGILDDRMYRWGYYLGTGAFSKQELSLALHALASQAAMQGDPRIQTVYDRLEKRLRGLNLELGGQLLYPVRTQLDRAIVPTNPDEMQRKGQYKSTLFAKLPELEQAIINGQAIELYRQRSPYHPKAIGHQAIYPLQLIYSDIAWYLLSENLSNGHLALSRVDRFTDYLRILPQTDRSMELQQASLQTAHELLRNGWGLSLGNYEEQQLERAGQLPLEEIQVRFLGSVVPFILEADSRHPKQRLRNRRRDKQGNPIQVDYCIPLPRRSWFEFSRWVRSFGSNAQVLAPTELVAEFQQMAIELAQRYPIN